MSARLGARTGSWPPASYHPPCGCHHPWDEPCPTSYDETCGCRHGQPHRCGRTGIARPEPERSAR